MSWTDERIETLKKLWTDGKTASQIAAELGDGVSRNAVIGKAHRLGLASRPSPLKTDGANPRPTVKKAAVAKTTRKVTLLDLTERKCKWPIGHPGEADFHFCGEKSTPGQPYCPPHAAEAYQAPAPRRDRRSRKSGS
ncbi:MAG: GcrA family cell cycle regulator [Sphingomonadales bacterium]